MNGFAILLFPNAEEAERHGFNYNEWETRPVSVTIKKTVVVKNGTQAGHATVDFIMEDDKGNKFVCMTTARLLEALVGATK